MKKIYIFLLGALAIGSVKAQNSCATAPALSLDQNYFCDGVNGTEQPPEFCEGEQSGADSFEWYQFTPAEDMALTVSSNLDPLTDTRVHIFSGTCGNLECEGGDDDSGANYSSVATLNVEAGVTYYIVWDDRWSNAAFNFILTAGETIEDQLSFTNTSVTTLGAGFTDCVVDMNGDFLDDVVSVTGTTIRVNEQQEDGTFVFQDYNTTDAQHLPTWSIAAGDLDGNGYNDLLYAGGSGVTFMIANEDGSAYEELSFDEYVFCQRSNMVDINADGHLDAFVCHDVDPNVFFMNDGENNFTFFQGGLGDTPGGGNYGSVWIDYDNDCDIDLFLAKCRGGDSPANINQMHRNNGNGTFQEVGDEINMMDNVQTWSSAWADYDNDGDMDAVIGASSFTNGIHRVMQNDGTGNFTDVVEGSGYDNFGSTGIEYAPADMNNDGYVDVLGPGNVIMMNNGDMSFTPSPVPASTGAIGDLNNDGFLDIMRGGTIYLNDGNNNHWIKINTIGTASNKNGIGARVKIVSAMGEQIRDVRSGEGFSYMSSLTTHFGIGDDTEIERIEICWPSGIVDVIENPEIDTTHNIVEGTFVVGVEEEITDALSIFPNPAADVINITADIDLTNANVEIFDINGKRVMATTLKTNTINVRELNSGIYIMVVRNNGNTIQEKFTKL